MEKICEFIAVIAFEDKRNGHISAYLDDIWLKLSIYTYFKVLFHLMWSKYMNYINIFL